MFFGTFFAPASVSASAFPSAFAAARIDSRRELYLPLLLLLCFCFCSAGGVHDGNHCGQPRKQKGMQKQVVQGAAMTRRRRLQFAAPPQGEPGVMRVLTVCASCRITDLKFSKGAAYDGSYPPYVLAVLWYGCTFMQTP